MLHISTPQNMGTSTSTFFGIDSFDIDQLNPGGDAWRRRQNHLHPFIRTLEIDEIGILNCSHLASASNAAVLSSSEDGHSPYNTLDPNAAFGKYNVIITGDIMQLPPIPPGQPLWSTPLTPEQLLAQPGTDKKRLRRDMDQEGRKVWRQFNDVFILRKQHRVTDDDDGRQLLDLQDMLESEQLTKDQVMISTSMNFIYLCM